MRAAERAVAADPRYALAWANLGALRRDIGDDAGAETALRRALALDPRQRGALLTLAGLLRDRSDLAGAAQCFARAAELDRRDANALLQLAGTLAERDDLGGARAAYAKPARRDPRDAARAASVARSTLPMMPASADAVAAAREVVRDGLAQLEREVPAACRRLAADRLLDELRWTNFLLAYQGEDDRPLQARYAAVVHEAADDAGARMAAARRAASACAPSRVKVGFVSTFFRDGTAGRYFEHWITDLPRDRFEVFAYHLLPGIDPLAQRIAARADTSGTARGGVLRRSRRAFAPTRSTCSCIRSSAWARCRSRSRRCVSRRCNAPDGDIR